MHAGLCPGRIGLGGNRLPAHASFCVDALGSFSFRFALPALVFQLIGREPLATLFEPAFFAAYVASGCLIFALTFAAFRRAPRACASARATTATVSNLGFLGPPLILAFFGARGVGPLAMTIVSEVMIIMSIGAIIMANDTDDDRGVGALLIRDA